MNNHHSIKKGRNNRAAIKAYIKAKTLGVATRHVVQRGGPLKIHLDDWRIQEEGTYLNKVDPTAGRASL